MKKFKKNRNHVAHPYASVEEIKCRKLVDNRLVQTKRIKILENFKVKDIHIQH
jgi:hypothetical protein